MANNEIQQLIQSFAAQLEAAAKKAALEQVLATLGGSMPATKRGRGPGRPKGSTNKLAAAVAPSATAIMPVRKGKRRTAEDVEAMGTTLVDYVKANPGQRADEIAKALRTDVGTMRLPMQALLAAKKVKTQGQRRGTKYFVAGAAMPAAAKKKSRRGRKKK
ncbi:MAG TPA: hypothetical protein VGP93_01665 [Polyangiaceae bacterium]|jgi:hypothetical protein|nr:hypothetical protein [Polyangiaceae bacterium]